MKIGFAGLGIMGSIVAQNIANAGYDVYVWNRTKKVAEGFSKKCSATAVAVPRDLSTVCDIVFTMLADDVASEQVHFGEDGLFSDSEGAKIYIQMGTMSPNHIFNLEEKARSIGKKVLDAPVSGSTKLAQNATLTVLFGGNEELYSKLKEVFALFSSKVIILENLGAGAIMKLVVNSLIHGLNQTLSEALVLAENAGITREQAYSVIENSAAAAPMLHYRKDSYLEDTKHPVSFALKLACKDMNLILGLAHECGVLMPQASLNYKKLVEANEEGLGNRDMAAMVEFMKMLQKR